MNLAILDVLDAQASVGGRVIHRPVSFTIDAGESVLIRGCNGVGKTSLLWSILGLRKLIRGSSLLDGKLVQFRSTWRETSTGTLSFVTQFPSAPASFTIAEYMSSCSSHNQTSEFVDLLNMSLRPEGMKLSNNSLLGTLSIGQRKAIELSHSLIKSTKLIAADEPFSGLAPMLQLFFVEKLNKYTAAGGSLLVVAHAPEHQHITFDRIIEVFPL